MLAVSAFAADDKLDTLLKGVETRYNRAKTCKSFSASNIRRQASRSGRKAASSCCASRARCAGTYSQPKGKLFVSDGKTIWLYTPGENRAEKMKLKESEDMRAPLAFLLGKLDFERSSAICRHAPRAPTPASPPSPRRDNLPYSAVEFVVSPTARSGK